MQFLSAKKHRHGHGNRHSHHPGQGLEWGIVLGFLAVGACGAYGTGHLDVYRGVSRA